MPIYEFICESCGNEFEQIQSFSESRMPTCIQCGSANVGRRMSRPAIHFKGSGWYITDSKKASDNKGGEGKNGSSGGEGSKESSQSDRATESKTETKAESKTETKTETKRESSTTNKSAATSVASD